MGFQGWILQKLGPQLIQMLEQLTLYLLGNLDVAAYTCTCSLFLLQFIPLWKIATI